MSQSHFNYMNGVPVKIAENYKPPKKLALNQSVAQRLTNSSQVTTQTLADCNYDFTLERTVLAKMAEWQQLRQHEIADRKERLRVHQQDRQKQLEAKQKQMLTAVSYPSTDDLSSTDDDGDDSGHGTLSDASKSAISMKTSATAVPIQSNAVLRNQQQQFSPPNNFDSILVPTVMPDQNYKPNALKTPSYTKINYSDFENDTSSPFDNCELKTINDLDILAEVLNRTVSVNKDDAKNTEKSADTKPDKQKKNSTIQANKEVQQQQQQQAPQSVYQNVYQNQEQATHQQYNHSRASMIQNSANPINSYYVHQMNYDHQANATQPNYYSAAMNSNLPYAGVPNQYVPNNYYNSNYTQSLAMSMHAPNAIRPTLAAIANATSYDDNTVITANSNIQTKAKWKSVPDIMQEINDEITNSEGKRVRNNSQSKSFLGIFSV